MWGRAPGRACRQLPRQERGPASIRGATEHFGVAPVAWRKPLIVSSSMKRRLLSAAALAVALALLNIAADGFARGWFRALEGAWVDNPDPSYRIIIDSLGEAVGTGLASSPVAVALLVLVFVHAALSLVAPDFAHRYSRRGHAVFTDTWALCRASRPALLVVGAVIGCLVARLVVVGAVVASTVPAIF